MKIKLILNPKAGINDPRERMNTIVNILGEDNELNIQLTKKPFDAFDFAYQASNEGYDIVIGGGGDGTINQVVNGVARAGKPVSLGFLPLGTSNAYAMSLGIPMNANKACEIIKKNNTEKIDLARINTSSGYHYFINMAGAGFDAETVGAVNPAHTKMFGGIVSHLIAGAYSLFRSERAPLSVEIDGTEHKAYQLFIFNGKYFGGFIKMAPFADMTDGFLDVYLFKKGSKGDVVRYFSGVVGRYHHKLKDVEHYHAKNIKVNSIEPVLVHLDGEVIGSLPREFEVCPQCITVIVPEEKEKYHKHATIEPHDQ